MARTEEAKGRKVRWGHSCRYGLLRVCVSVACRGVAACGPLALTSGPVTAATLGCIGAGQAAS